MRPPVPLPRAVRVPVVVPCRPSRRCLDGFRPRAGAAMLLRSDKVARSAGNVLETRCCRVPCACRAACFVVARKLCSNDAWKIRQCSVLLQIRARFCNKTEQRRKCPEKTIERDDIQECRPEEGCAGRRRCPRNVGPVEDAPKGMALREARAPRGHEPQESRGPKRARVPRGKGPRREKGPKKRAPRSR